jgi:hypothetical protein
VSSATVLKLKVCGDFWQYRVLPLGGNVIEALALPYRRASLNNGLHLT